MKNQDWQNRETEAFGTGLGKIVRTLPLGGKLTKLDVIMRGTLNITGAGSNGTAKYQELLAGLIQRIRVRVAKADGSRYPDGLIRDYSPRTILRRAEMFRGKYIGDLLATACTGAAGAYTIYYCFTIWFSQPDLRNRIETALNCDPSAYQNIQVEIDTGNRDTCFTGNTNTWDFSSLYFDFVDQREAVDGDTYVLVETDHEVLIPGATDRFEDKNMEKDGALLDVLYLAQNGTTASGPTLADNVLNEVKIAGPNLDYDLKANDIRQEMYDRFNHRAGLDAGQSGTGLYHVNFVASGMLSKVVPAAGLDVKLNVSNPSGANNDSLLVSARRLLQPVGFTPIVSGKKGKNN